MAQATVAQATFRPSPVVSLWKRSAAWGPMSARSTEVQPPFPSNWLPNGRWDPGPWSDEFILDLQALGLYVATAGTVVEPVTVYGTL